VVAVGVLAATLLGASCALTGAPPVSRGRTAGRTLARSYAALAILLAAYALLVALATSSWSYSLDGGASCVASWLFSCMLPGGCSQLVATPLDRLVIHGPHVFNVSLSSTTHPEMRLCDSGRSIASLPAVGDLYQAAAVAGLLDERSQPPPTSMCPRVCNSPPPKRATKKRVRRALHTLSDEQLARLSAAMRIMSNVSTVEGQKRYGPAYRDYAYLLYRHLAASYRGSEFQFDVTGGGPQQLVWHAFELAEFENALLAVDPSIDGLPYLDWPALLADHALVKKYLGSVSCSQEGDPCLHAEGKCWTETSVATLKPDDACIVDEGPFAWWPIPAVPDEVFDSCGGDCLKNYLLRGQQPNTVLRNAPFPAILEHALGQSRVQAGWKRAVLFYRRPEGEFPKARPPAYVMRAPGNLATRAKAMGWTGPEYKEAFRFCSEGLASYASEVQLCLEGRLAVQPLDMHATIHGMVGGEMGSGSSAVADPLFFFAHATNDLLFSQWKAANPHLRPYAYGYPRAAGYNLTNVGLHDLLGFEAHNGVGAFTEGTVIGGDASEPGTPGARTLTAADALCGPIENLYTYDVLEQPPSPSPPTRQQKRMRLPVTPMLTTGMRLCVFTAGVAVLLLALCGMLVEAQLLRRALDMFHGGPSESEKRGWSEKEPISLEEVDEQAVDARKKAPTVSRCRTRGVLAFTLLLTLTVLAAAAALEHVAGEPAAGSLDLSLIGWLAALGMCIAVAGAGSLMQ